MAYKPKSKFNVLDTPGGRLVYKSNYSPYVGKYIELSNGKFYAGSDPSNLGGELIIPLSTNRITDNKNSNVYSSIRLETANFLSTVKAIYPFKNIPTEDDYKKGYYNRYFAKKINEPRGYIEIDSDVYNSINEGKKEYDFRLYIVGSITWNLKNGTSEPNSINLKVLERTFPFVSLLFPKLNEFERIDQIVNNLNTEGGELYFANGQEYVGPYHVHPELGPMVGAQHITQPHENLYYFEDIPDPQSSPEPDTDAAIAALQQFNRANRVDALAQTNRIPTSTRTTTPTRTYTGGGSPMRRGGSY